MRSSVFGAAEPRTETLKAWVWLSTASDSWTWKEARQRIEACRRQGKEWSCLGDTERVPPGWGSNQPKIR